MHHVLPARPHACTGAPPPPPPPTHPPSPPTCKARGERHGGLAPARQGWVAEEVAQAVAPGQERKAHHTGGHACSEGAETVTQRCACACVHVGVVGGVGVPGVCVCVGGGALARGAAGGGAHAEEARGQCGIGACRWCAPQAAARTRLVPILGGLRVSRCRRGPPCCKHQARACACMCTGTDRQLPSHPGSTSPAHSGPPGRGVPHPPPGNRALCMHAYL